MEFERIKRQHVHIDIAPLVDVVFLLLLFFMLAFQLVADHGFRVRLPDAATAQVQNTSEVEITVDAQGDLYVGQRLVALEELIGVLRGLRISREQPLIIRADRETSVGALVSIMDIGRMAGFTSVSVLTDIPRAMDTQDGENLS